MLTLLKIKRDSTRGTSRRALGLDGKIRKSAAWQLISFLLALMAPAVSQDIFQTGSLQGTGAVIFTPALYHGIYATVGSYSRYVIAGVNSNMQCWSTNPTKYGDKDLWTGFLSLGVLYSSNPYNSGNPLALHAFFMEPDLFAYFGVGQLNVVQLSTFITADTMSTFSSTENSKFTSIWAGTAQTGTNFAFIALLPTASTYKVARWDKSTTTLIEGPTGTGTARGLSLTQSNSIVIGGTSNTLEVYDIATLSFIKTTAFVYQTFLMIDDNLNFNSLLIAHNALLSGSYGLSRIYLTGEFATSAQITTGMISRISSMINLGTFNYVLVSYPSSNAGQIYDKTTLTLTQTYSFDASPTCAGACSPAYHTMAFAGMGTGNQVNFMMHAGDNKIYSRSIKPITAICSAYSGSLCTSCAASYYLLASKGQCYSVPNIPDGYGIASATTLLACSATNCWKCASNINACIRCNTGYFLKSDAANTCVLNNIVGYGQKTAAGQPTIEPCTASNCANCLATSTTCTTCSAGYFLKSDAANTCVLNNIAGYGQKTAAGQPTIEPCTTNNCVNCFAGSTLCVECTSTYAVKNDVANQCFLRSTTAYYGPTPADQKMITRCSVINCNWCATTYAECSQCDSGYLLLSGISDVCFLPGQKREMILVASSFDSSRNLVNLKFDSLIDVKQFKTLLSISTKDASGNALSGVSIKSIDMAVNSTGVDILIEHSLNVKDAKIEIGAIDTSSSVFTYVDAEFPASIIIKIEGINLVSAAEIIQRRTENRVGTESQKNRVVAVVVGSSLVALTQIISSTTSVGSGSLGSASFGSFLKLISVLEYLSMTNGNRTVFSEQFLNLFRASPLEIIKNPIAIDEDRLNCTPTDNFAREMISCNVMNNYGSEFMSLFMLLGIVLILIVFNRVIRHLRKRNKTIGKILHLFLFIPNALVNAEMFVAMIDGSHIELSRIGFINIFNSNSMIAQIIGVTISACVLVIYSVYTWMLYRACREFSTGRKVNKDSKISKVLAFNFEEFRTDARWPLSYYTPLIIVLKNVISQLILVLLGGSGLAQLYALMAAEVVGVGLSVLQTLGQKGWKTYGRILVSLCYCAILSLYTVLNTEFVGNQYSYGIALCALYSIIIGLQLISMIEVLIQALVDFYKEFMMKKKRPIANLSLLSHNKVAARIVSKLDKKIDNEPIEPEIPNSKHKLPSLSSKIKFQGHVQSANRLRIGIPNIIAKNKSNQTSSFTIAGKSVNNVKPAIFHISKMKAPTEKIASVNQAGSPLLDSDLSSMTKISNVRSNTSILRSTLIHGLNNLHQNKVMDAGDIGKSQE